MANPTQPQGQRERFEEHLLSLLAHADEMDHYGWKDDATIIRTMVASHQELVVALERIANPRNIHFAGDAQVVARAALSAYKARAEGVGGVPGTQESAAIDALRRILKCDDDAKAARGKPTANLNGVGLVDLFDLVGHPFGVGKHQQQPCPSNHLVAALDDARAALNAIDGVKGGGDADPRKDQDRKEAEISPDRAAKLEAFARSATRTYQHDVEAVHAGMQQAAFAAWKGSPHAMVHLQPRDEQDRWRAVVQAVTAIDRKTQAEGFWHQRPEGVEVLRPTRGDDVVIEVVKWALNGHITERGATVEACAAIRAVADGVVVTPNEQKGGA